MSTSSAEPSDRLNNAITGKLWLHCEGSPELLFTENETNMHRLFGVGNRTPYVKDGINNFVVNGDEGAVNPQRNGTKSEQPSIS